MKVSQLDDYDAAFCKQQYMHGSFHISLFKFKSFDQFNTPQTASNFRHLLSCGTIEAKKPESNSVKHYWPCMFQLINYLRFIENHSLVSHDKNVHRCIQEKRCIFQIVNCKNSCECKHSHSG